MSYVARTWAALEKLTAAGVNRMEAGIASADAAVKTINGAAPDANGNVDGIGTSITRKAAYRFGGTHSTSNMGGTTQTMTRQRTPGLVLPVNATRWRLHFRNWNQLQSVRPGTGNMTVVRALAAPQSKVTAVVQTPYQWDASQPLQQMPGASAAISGKTEWVSDWHTPASVGVTDTRQPFVIQMDLNYTAADYIATHSAMFCAMIDTTNVGTQGSVTDPTYQSPGNVGATASATAWYTYNYMIGDAWLEYEYTDDQVQPEIPNVLFVGHSYVDGSQFSATAGSFGTPSGFAQAFARRHKVAATVNAIATSKITDWVNGSTISDKFDILTVADGYKFDAIVVMLGGNDIVNEATTPSVSTLTLRFISLINAISIRYPNTPIYAITNTPFGATGDTTFGSGGKAVTAAMLTSQDGFNAALWSTFTRLAGVFDFEKAIWDPANNRRPLAAYLGTDNIHPNRRGYDKLADALTLF